MQSPFAVYIILHVSQSQHIQWPTKSSIVKWRCFVYKWIHLHVSRQTKPWTWTIGSSSWLSLFRVRNLCLLFLHTLFFLIVFLSTSYHNCVHMLTFHTFSSLFYSLFGQINGNILICSCFEFCCANCVWFNYSVSVFVEFLEDYHYLYVYI